jgi:hypothetical protein
MLSKEHWQAKVSKRYQAEGKAGAATIASFIKRSSDYNNIAVVAF